MKKSLLSAVAVFGMLAAQAQSPVVNYSFENVLISSGSGGALTHNSNNAIFSDNARTGNGIYSLSLSGSEYLTSDFSVPTGLTGYTVNYWVKLGSKPNYNVGVTNLRRVQVSGVSEDYFGSFITATDGTQKPYFEVFTSTDNADIFTAPDSIDNNWHMLTFKWKTDSAFIYVDGVQKLKNSGPSTFIASNEKLSVGALPNNIDGVPGYQSSFGGDIDEIRIYETGLSDASILSLYNTGAIVSSINDVAGEIKVGMYPNPAHTVLNIKTSEHLVKAEVFNLMGSLVHREEDTIESINVAELTQGVYVLRLTAGNGKQITRKFTKE